jgi:hypothetical protein
MTPFFFLLPMLFWGILLGGGFYLAMRLIRALEVRTPGGGQAAELAELRTRLARLEEGLDGTARRLDAMEEAQEFTTRLLTEGEAGGK